MPVVTGAPEEDGGATAMGASVVQSCRVLLLLKGAEESKPCSWEISAADTFVAMAVVIGWDTGTGAPVVVVVVAVAIVADDVIVVIFVAAAGAEVKVLVETLWLSLEEEGSPEETR